MLTGNHENISQESLQIKQDDKFFSRLMSKETSMANSSSRRVSVYYGGASGSVPFIWESQPGTPKHTLFNDNTLPAPLTPPPSYQSISKSNSCQETNAKPNNHLLSCYINFPRLVRSKNNNHISPSSSWSCNSSSSSSSSSSNSRNSKKWELHRRDFSSTRLPMVMHFHNEDDGNEEEEEEEKNCCCRGRRSPTSTLCFNGGGLNKRRSLSKYKGCCSMMKMKKALLAFVVGSYGSGGQGTAS